MDYTETFLRLVLAVVFGGLIGLEREIVHRPAGVRTHMLVSLGSALFVLITLATLPTEIARIIAGIATGIGFLGAGTIFRDKDHVRGLTTAASIWAVSGIGIAMGTGYYFAAIVASALIFLTLQIKKFENRGIKR